MQKEKYLIKNSTKEERKKRVAGSITISMLDAKEPTPEAKEMYEHYIEGDMELDEILEKTIKRYREN